MPRPGSHAGECRRPARSCRMRGSMKLPAIYPILDSESLERRGLTLTTAAASLLEGGAGILQIRHKTHWPRSFFDATRDVARLCRQAGSYLIVNDRAALALLLDACLLL